MREKVCEKEYKQEEGRERGKKGGTCIHPYRLLAIHIVHCTCISVPHNLRICTSRDSENVQCNLEIVQVLRLRGTCPYLYLWCVCPELAVVLGIAVL